MVTTGNNAHTTEMGLLKIQQGVIREGRDVSRTTFRGKQSSERGKACPKGGSLRQAEGGSGGT